MSEQSIEDRVVMIAAEIYRLHKDMQRTLSFPLSMDAVFEILSSGVQQVDELSRKVE